MNVRDMRALLRPLVRLGVSGITRLTHVRRINGERFLLPPAAGRHMLPFIDVAYERAEWDAVLRYGQAGSSFLDVGANIGIIAVAMSRLAGPEGRVLAAEPQPAVHGLLSETLRLNGCANAVPMQTLISDACGVVPFYVSRATELGVASSIFQPEYGAGDGGTMLRLPAVTIDALYPAAEPLDYVKIDAEGAEARILSGARQVLARCRPVVQVEVHGEQLAAAGDSIASLFADMAEQGYVCLNLLTGRRTDAAEFAVDTGYHVRHPDDGRDLAAHGYGQVVFLPEERG